MLGYGVKDGEQGVGISYDEYLEDKEEL